MTRLGKVWTFAVGHPATLPRVAEVLSHAGVEGATLSDAVGLWQGQHERSVRVEIAGLSRFAAERIAEELRAAFDQDAVYLSDGAVAWTVDRAPEPATSTAEGR